MVKIIDGVKLAQAREVRLAELVKQQEVKFKLVSLVMKDDEGGRLYSRLKKEAAERVGIKFKEQLFDAGKVDEMVRLIKQLNQDKTVQGIMIQRPGVIWSQQQGMKRSEFEAWWQRLVGVIGSGKDVDGLTADSKFTPAVVKAVQVIIEELKVKSGKTVVVGSQGMIGRELIKYFQRFPQKPDGSRGKWQVEGLDLETKNLAVKTKQADILILATGQAGLIKAEMVKPGATVIDVGWPKGDVRFDEVKEKAGVITPVPGGVGPLTVVSLLENLVANRYTKG